MAVCKYPLGNCRNAPEALLICSCSEGKTEAFKPEKSRESLLSTDGCELVLLNDGAGAHSRQPLWGGKDREGNNTDNDLNE